MAKIDHIKSLLKHFINNDSSKFKTTILQIAAYEAKQGHSTAARELRELIEKADISSSKIIQLNTENNMFVVSHPNNTLDELVVTSEIHQRIARILNEFANRQKLYGFGLSNRRKILLEGDSGTGKTLTASIIAGELKLPLYNIQTDKIVTKFMGETSAKLRLVFDSIQKFTGVYLFDEFDAIGADRSLDNEVGEMRRILNSFLQFIEQDESNSIIIAATNNHDILDKALYRRFDDVLHYSLPDEEKRKAMFIKLLRSYKTNFRPSKQLIEISSGLSHADITNISNDAIKTSILNNSAITQEQLIELVGERTNVYKRKIN